MKHRFRSRLSAKGLTLIELAVTVAVLAIIATLAAPSFASFIAMSKLRGAANEVFADLQFARSESVQKNQVFQVEFASDGYSIWRMDRNTPTQHATSTVAQPNPIKNVQWASGSAIASGGSSMVVAYDPLRASASVTDGPLELSHAALSGMLRITVHTTGRTELCTPSGGIKGFASC